MRALALPWKALVVGLVVGLVASAAVDLEDEDCSRAGDRCRGLRLGRAISTLTSIVYPYLLFAPTTASAPAANGYVAGQGLPTLIDLCAATAAVDSAWDAGTKWGCWTASGNVAGATQLWGDAGTWTPQVDDVLPSGQNGTALSSVRVTTGGGFQTEADTDAPAALSGCVWYSPDDTTDMNFFGKGYHGSNATSGWFLERAPSSIVFRVSDGTTLSNGASLAYTQTIGAITVACFRYVYSGTPGTTSISQICVDGVCSSVNSTTRGPINNASIRTVIGKDSSFVFKGRVFGAMVTEKDLGATALQSIGHLVVADQPVAAVNGQWDAGLVYGGVTSPFFCERNSYFHDGGTWDGAGSIVPPGRPCVSAGLVYGAPSRTNLAIRSQEIQAGSGWANFGAVSPTITQNYGVAPDGTLTAERLQAAATTTTDSSIVYQTITGSALCSLYLKGTSGPGVVDVGLDGTAGTSGNACGCAYSATAWTRCLMTAQRSGSLFIGNDGRANSCGSGTRAATDVLIWGAQCEAGNATAYTPTAGATVARGTANLSFAGLSIPTTNGLSVFTTQLAAGDSSALSSWGFAPSVYQDVSNRSQLYRVFSNGTEADILSTGGNRTGATTNGTWATLERFGLVYSGAGASSTVARWRGGAQVGITTGGTTSAFTGTSVFLNGLTSAAANDSLLTGNVVIRTDSTGDLR